MKTSMIGHDKKDADVSSLGSVANLLTSYMGQSFAAKIEHYQNAQVENDSPFHNIALERFMRTPTPDKISLGQPVAMKNPANAQTTPFNGQVCDSGLSSQLHSLGFEPAKVVESKTTESLASLQTKSSSAVAAQDGMPFQDIVQEASQTYGVPVALINAVIKQESAFKPGATSHCGAMGLMQLMPATAKAYGCNDAYDPKQNVMAGTRFLGDLLKRYKGDVTLATAAYNAGPGNVSKYGHKVPPFKETQDYVAKVGRNYQANLAALKQQQDRFAQYNQPEDEKNTANPNT